MVEFVLFGQIFNLVLCFLFFFFIIVAVLGEVLKRSVFIFDLALSSEFTILLISCKTSHMSG